MDFTWTADDFIYTCSMACRDSMTKVRREVRDLLVVADRRKITLPQLIEEVRMSDHAYNFLRDACEKKLHAGADAENNGSKIALCGIERVRLMRRKIAEAIEREHQRREERKQRGRKEESVP